MALWWLKILFPSFLLLPFSCWVEYYFQRLNLRHIKCGQARAKFSKKDRQAKKSNPLEAFPEEQGREKMRMRPKLPKAECLNTSLETPPARSQRDGNISVMCTFALRWQLIENLSTLDICWKQHHNILLWPFVLYKFPYATGKG